MAVRADSWSAPYEAPTSLIDGERLIGAHPRRQTLWTMAAGGGLILMALLVLIFQQPVMLSPIGLWLCLCVLMSRPMGKRTPEYWVRRMIRYRRLPRDMDTNAVARHHAMFDETIPRGVVKVTETRNLRMADDDTLSTFTKRLHQFYLWLRFPVQVTIRARIRPDGFIDRQWFIAATASTDEVLKERLEDIKRGLKRAGLDGEILNGELYDVLHACWTRAERNGRIGPHTIHRERKYSIVDGEYVRGVLLASIPRAVEPNWLAPILDGDLPIDVSMWLDPLDNAAELQDLSRRHTELESAQLLNVGSLPNAYSSSGSNGRLGYRDPDLDEEIVDVKRTRRMLSHHVLRVLQATIGFVVRGDTEEEMWHRDRLLWDQLQEQVGVQPVLPLDYEQDRAALLAVPLGEAPASFPLRIVSPALARTYPFSNSCVSMEHGVSCGTSAGSRRENLLNLFGLLSPHMVIPATTGAGKGYWVKVFLLRWLKMPEWAGKLRVVILQSEKDEYGALVDALGARSRRITIEKSGQLATHLDEQGRYTDLSDLTLIDMTRMAQSDKGAEIAHALEALDKTYAWLTPPMYGVAVVDELGIVLRSKQAADVIETCYRRFRSIPWGQDPRKVNRIAMIGMTQRPADLLGHENGRALKSMSAAQLYLRSDSSELRAAQKLLNLSPDEVEYLELGEEGDALLVAGNMRVGMHLHATDEEHEIART